MSFDPYEFDRSYGSSAQGLSEGEYTARTFLWMVLGLMVTFGVAVLCWLTNATIYALILIPAVQVIVLIATLILSFVMVRRIERMSVAAARTMFLIFSALFGFTMSIYLLIYDLTSLVFAFLATALYFGSAGGLWPPDRAGPLRNPSDPVFRFALSGDFGVISLFIPALSLFDSISCLIGIAVFLGYTAYDTQRIRAFYHYYAGYPDMLEKASIFAALQLYLDFVNLFLYLLRFLGRRRD